MRQHTNPVQFSAAALAACLLLSACGGGDAEPPPLIATAPAPAPTPAPPPPAPPAPAPTPAGNALATFDEATPPAIVEFGGAGYAIEAGPAGGSGLALRISRPGGEVFAGAFVTTAPIPFSATRKTITARVYSPTAGIPMVAKAEYADNAGTGDTAPTTAVVGGWQTLTWVFNNVDLTKSYTRFTILPNLGTVGSGQNYFFDDITLAPAGAAPPPAPAPTGTTLLSFDESTPAFTGMGAYGGAVPTVEAGPAGGSGNALKILKPVSPDTWGGTFFNLAAIPFAASRTTLTARVYSTRAGAVVRLKVEIAGGASVEVAGSPAVAANTWTTVSWDLGAVDLTKAYTVIAITPDVDVVTTGQSYYIDDITLAPAVAAPPPPPAGATFISFDETTPVFTDMGAYGGAQPTVEAGPAGGTGNALKILKPASPDTWGGVFFTTPTIPFSAGNKALTARVYSTRANAVITFKVEVPGGTSVEVAGTPAVAANTWTNVSWDFSAADLSKAYKIMAITPDVTTVTTGQSYYIDEIKIAASAAAPAPATPVTIATLDEPTAAVVGFEGCYDSTLVADPAGGTNKVGRVVKPGSGVPFYCGTTVVTVPNGGYQAIPFTASATTMTARVWSPDVGIPVRLKVEDIADPTKSVETEATTTAVGWQTLTFNFANAASGTPVLNLATTYNKASIFFNFGTVGSGKTYYFDDVTFVTGTGTDTVVVTFDERNFDNTQSQPSVLNGFGGAENSTVIGYADVGVPADGAKTGKLAKVVKNAGETYAGTSMQRKPNDAVPTIPFATGATKMSVRVYSAYIGMRVHLKVEQSGRPDFNSEVDAFTTLANTWETLTFDFGPAGKHFVPSGPGPNGYITDPASPAYRPTSQLDVSKTFNKVNIFFDYGLGDAGYDAMPGTRTYYFDDVRFVGP